MTQEEIYAAAAKVVTYYEETGIFTALQGTSCYFHHKGYVWVKAGKSSKVLAHRLAWYMVHGKIPSNQIDHINHKKADNRICNLREATNSENHRNKLAQANNTSGTPGVARNTRGNRWQAYIKHHGKRIHLGVFAAYDQAVAARREAEKLYFGEFAANAH